MHRCSIDGNQLAKSGGEKTVYLSFIFLPWETLALIHITGNDISTHYTFLAVAEGGEGMRTPV